MGGGGNVGYREMIASEPAPPLDEIAEVVEMVGQVCVAGANRQRIRLAQAGQPLHHLLAEQILGHFEVHLDVEPRGETPDLGSIDWVYPDQELLAIDLV